MSTKLRRLRRSMSTSESSSCSEIGDVSQLRRDYQMLQDELTQCKADKEFVWSLWKRLQVANPDITQAISLVLQREKEKSDSKESNLYEIISLKEHCIDKLEKATAHQAHVINELLARKLELTGHIDKLGLDLNAANKQISSLGQQVIDQEKKNAEAASREAVRELDAKNLDLKQQLSSKVEELNEARSIVTELSSVADDQRRKVSCQEEVIKSLESNNSNVTQEISKLKEQLRRAEAKVQSLAADGGCKSSELESTRRELSELHSTHRNTVNVSTNQAQLIDQLQALHRETQTVLRNQEEAYAMELASLQRTLLEQNEVIEDQREMLKQWSESQKFPAPSTIETEDSFERTELIAADARIQVLEAEVKLLREGERNVDTESRARQTSLGTVRRRVRSQGPSVKFRPSSRSLSRSPERHPDEMDEVQRKNIQNNLNITEKKLDDLRHLLSLKNNELETLRASHGRRLERLRSLQNSYRLVKRQNQLFLQEQMTDIAASSSVINKTKQQRPARPDGKTLQREDSDDVWNELSHLRRENKTLNADNLRLVEEADLARIQSASLSTALQELKCQLQQQKDDFMAALEKSEHRTTCEKENTATVKKQLESLRNQHSSMKREVNLIHSDRENILSEKRDLLCELRLLKEHIGEQNLKLCQQKKELLKLQRKLRRKPTVGGVVNKLTLSRLAPKRSVVEESIHDSVASGEDGDRNDWQDLSSETDEESTPVSDLFTSTESRNTARLEAEKLKGLSDYPSRRGLLKTSRANIEHRTDKGSVRRPRDISKQHPEVLTEEQMCAIRRYVTALTRKFERAQRRHIIPVQDNMSDSSLPRKPDGFDPPVKQSLRSVSSLSNGSTVAGFVATGNAAIRRTCSVLKKRVETLQTQLTVLKTARDMSVRSCDQLKIDCDSLQEQLLTSNQKLASSKQLTQRLNNEVDRLKAERDLRETKGATNYNTSDGNCSGASAAGEQELFSVQCRLKAATATLSRQLDKIKELKIDKEKQADKITKLTERVDHLERDVAQKRQLVDDYKLKLSLSQENAESDADIMLEVEAKLKSLNEHNGRLKSEVERLKTRVSTVIKEKHDTQLSVRKLSEQLDRKTKLSVELQKRNLELMSTCAATERNAESHMQQLAARTESAIDTAQSRLLYADGRLGFHAQFVQVLAQKLLNDIRKSRSAILLRREEKERKMKSRGTRRPRQDVTSPMLPGDDVKQLACDILDLSQSDFNDIMSVTSQDIERDRESECEFDAEEKVYDAKKDTEWAKKCERLLKSTDDFSQRLVELFVEKIEERCRLSNQLNQDFC